MWSYFIPNNNYNNVTQNHYSNVRSSHIPDNFYNIN